MASRFHSFVSLPEGHCLITFNHPSIFWVKSYNPMFEPWWFDDRWVCGLLRIIQIPAQSFRTCESKKQTKWWNLPTSSDEIGTLQTFPPLGDGGVFTGEDIGGHEPPGGDLGFGWDDFRGWGVVFFYARSNPLVKLIFLESIVSYTSLRGGVSWYSKNRLPLKCDENTWRR